MYSCTDVDNAVHIFTEKLTNILDKMAPVRKFQTRAKYAPWISQEVKNKIKIRDAAQEKASKSGSLEDWEAYKRKRNDVTYLLKKEKQSWQSKKLENCEEKQDSGKLWKNVLGWLNWSSTSSPTRLLSQGLLVSSPNKMANIQNEYYVHKVLSIRDNLPQPQIDPLFTLRQKMEGIQTSFSLYQGLHQQKLTK